MKQMGRVAKWNVMAGIIGIGLASALGAFGQLPTATSLGVAKDSSGAVVPGAKITAHNAETGQTRTATSSNYGSHHIPALPVGSYEVRSEQTGFQTEFRSGLTLAAPPGRFRLPLPAC